MTLNYEGIKRLYPKVPLPQRIRGYIALVRPFTGVAPFLAGVFGASLPLLYGHSNPISQWRELIYVGFTLMLSQFSGQSINQAVGWREDKINKPYRPVAKGLITPDEAMGIGILLALAAIVRGYLTGMMFGLFVTIITFFGVFYNLEPLKVKYRDHWSALLWMSVSRGYLPFPAVWSVFGDLDNPIPHILGLITFLWCFSYQGTKDLSDYRGDKKFNIKTLATVYGVGKARSLIMDLGVISLFVSAWICLLLPANFKLLIVVLTIFTALQMFYLAKPKKIGYMENEVSWMLFYLGIGAIYLTSFLALLL